jgi:hypothetical protein
VILSRDSFSDDRGNGRSTAMAFSTMVSCYGVDAYGINPANYSYRIPSPKLTKKHLASDKKFNLQKPVWEISVFSVGGGYGSDSSIEFYNSYLNYLSIDRNKFVGLFTDLAAVLQFRDSILPGTKTDVNYDFELRWFNVNYSYPKIGSFNVSISDRVGLNTYVNSRDDYLPLNFGVNYDPYTQKTDLTNVNLAQSEAIAWWIRKYSIGYAKQFIFSPKSSITSFSIGLSSSLVHGFGNVSTYESKLNISTWGIKNNNGVNHVDSIKGKQDFHVQSALTDFFQDYKDGAESKFNLFPKPAGIGYSFDFGMTMQIGKQWKVAASVTDLGKISWNYNTITNHDTDSFAYYDFDLTGTDPTYNAMVDDLGGYHTQDTGTIFTSDMPTKIRAGISFQPSDRFLIELNWYKGLNDLPGNSRKNKFTFGAEYFPVYFLPIRAGISFGDPALVETASNLHPIKALVSIWENDNYFISIGAGIKFNRFTLDFGTHGINQLIQNKRFSVALSSRVIL